jgi:hypothetical protein
MVTAHETVRIEPLQRSAARPGHLSPWKGSFVKIVKRGLPVAATAMFVLAGVLGVAGTGVASATPSSGMSSNPAGRLTGPAPTVARGGGPVHGRDIRPTTAKPVGKPYKAGSARAVPHTVNLGQLLTTVKPQPSSLPISSQAARAIAPADLITPNGADVTSQFDGITEVNSGQAGGLPTIPSPSSATNGSQIVETTSNFIRAFDNNGAGGCGGTGTGVALKSFLQTSDSLGAPHVTFDNFQGHFIISVPVESFVSTSVPALYVVISNTSNPCGNWHWYRLTFSGGPYAHGNRLDTVILGQDRNAALFQATIFSSSQVFQAYSIFPIRKADLYAGSAVSFPAFTVGSQAAPAINAGEPMISSSSAWFVGADPNIGYQLYRMDGTGTASPTITLQRTISSPYNLPGDALEPNGFIDLAFEGRITSAAVFDGTRVWFAHSAGMPPNDPATVRYGYVDVTTNQLTGSLAFVDPPNSYEFNSSIGIGLNANGTESVFLNWAYTDPSKNLNVSDAVDSFVFNGSLRSLVGSLQTLVTGTAGDNSLFGFDSSVAVEPGRFGNTTCAITTQEYFNGSWSTRLARLCSPNQINVPFVPGLTPAQAAATLAGFGLAVGSQSTTTSCDGIIPGEVVSTTPAFDTPVPFGTAINLVVCTTPPEVRVPNVTGDTPDQAAAAIQSAGLTVGSTSFSTSCDVPAGTIIRTSPPAGDLVDPGTTVSLVQSTGKTPVCP